MKYGIYSFIYFLMLLQTSAFSQSSRDFSKYYDEYGIKGSFLLYDLNKGEYIYYDSARCNTQFIPASTFKIFNSLVSLEIGVVADENEIIKWDKVERDFKSWNQDLNMRLAIKYSAVWFYQELARRVGEERMQHYIDTVGYGNGDISGGIDRFWLDGDLRISQFEQIEFLKKLYNNSLPFSERSMNIVKDIMLNEDTLGYKLRAKTGWAMRMKMNIGWWVGWVESAGGNVYFFANNIEGVNPTENFIKGRIEITRKILKELNILP
jgi:beta-lactamase class D